MFFTFLLLFGMPLEYIRNYFYMAVHYAESTRENSVKTNKI